MLLFLHFELNVDDSALSFLSNFSPSLGSCSFGCSALAVWSSSGVRVREEPGGIFITLPTHCRWGLLLKSQGHQRAVLWPVLSFRSRPGFPELEHLGAGWQRGLVELQGGCRLEHVPWDASSIQHGSCMEHTHVCSLASEQHAWQCPCGVCRPAAAVHASAC